MKKNHVLSMLIIFLISFMVTGCGNVNNNQNKGNQKEQDNISDVLDNPTKNVEDLETLISNDVEEVISNLKTEYTSLKEKITTYDDYVSNVEDVKKFYAKIVTETEKLTIKMRKYSINYAELIIHSNKDNDDIYDDLNDLYDIIYDNALDNIYDEIYDGILDDMYDDFYDGVIDDAYDDVAYSEWSDIHSDEYDFWSDARSDVYDFWSDARSDIYDFWSDLRSAVYKDNIDKAEKEITEFTEDVKKME